MTSKKTPAGAPGAGGRGRGKAATPKSSAPAKETRAETLIRLMRAEGGASAAELATAVGWQLHSVRGFIAGALKKRADVRVAAVKTDGVTRYHVGDAATLA